MLHPYILPGKGFPLRGRLGQGEREEAWNLSVSFAVQLPLGRGAYGRGMDEAAAAGTSIVRETQPGETDGRAMHAPTVLMKCDGGGRTSQSASLTAPLGKGSQECGGSHGLAPLEESWCESHERGTCPRFADVQCTPLRVQPCRFRQKRRISTSSVQCSHGHLPLQEKA